MAPREEELDKSDSVDPDRQMFLKQHCNDDIVVSELDLDPNLTANLQSRVDEVGSSSKGKMPLGCIFLLGSKLEGLLLAMAILNPRLFMSASAAPKTKDGKPKCRPEWSLSELVNAARGTGLIGLDVKKFSHELQGFQNFIHPYQQLALRFDPDQITVDICWYVFKTAFTQLRGYSVLISNSSRLR